VTEYHKIDSLFKRDHDDKKTIIIGDYTNPIFEYLAHNVWEYTEKVDGTNMRIIVDKPFNVMPGTLELIPNNNRGISFNGKTDNAQLPGALVKKMQEKYLPMKDALLEAFPEGATIYGEGYGGSIQNGGYYRKDQDFIAFDVLVNDPESLYGWWLERHNVEDVAKQINTDVAPIIGQGTLIELVEFVKIGFPTRCHEGDWSSNGNVIAEGIVARPKVELKARNGSRIITKLKHKDFKHCREV
jgi:hypothetical protein